MRNYRNQTHSPEMKAFARVYMKGIRWLCFIPGGIGVGGLVAFAGMVFAIIFLGLIGYFFPENLPSFLVVVGFISFATVPVAFGFCSTQYGAHIAPSENKRIPGFVITLALVILIGSNFDYFVNLLNKFGRTVAILVCVAPVLTSFVTALFLKPVKGAADFDEDVKAPETPHDLLKNANHDAHTPKEEQSAANAATDISQSKWVGWLGFIPMGLAVGGVIFRLGLRLAATFPRFLNAFYPDWVEGGAFSITMAYAVYFFALLALVGYLMTTYAVKIVPTEEKWIAGFVMTFVIAALTGWIFILRPDLFENLENILKVVKAPTQIVCLIPVLASSVTAFRLKPKGTNS